MARLLIFRSVLAAAPILTVANTVCYVAKVEGLSMQPTLNPDVKQKDWVFLNRWAVRSYNVQHGDIVSLVSPKNPGETLIKRVIGLSGDIVSTIGYKTPIVEVPEGHCWVEGDHTGQSRDSNSFGPISLGLVTAKAICIVWPPSRWQYLESSLPEHRTPLHMSRPAAA